jgi:hypothetical protein
MEKVTPGGSCRRRPPRTVPAARRSLDLSHVTPDPGDLADALDALQGAC